MAYEDGKKKELKVEQILRDFRVAFENRQKFIEQSTEDIEFALGKQWDEEAVAKLKNRGIRALTINRIEPIIRAMEGIESDGRTDFHVFPKGDEDSVVSEIDTALLKFIADNSDFEYKFSEQFKEGLQGGECYLEPYLDYTHDLITPELKFRKVSSTRIYPSPNFQEYDLSDCKYICKLSTDLTEDELIELFPSKEKDIKNLGSSNIDLKGWDKMRTILPHVQKTDYPKHGEGTIPIPGTETEKTMDLLEYYYKKPVKKIIVIDKKLKELRIIELDKEQEAKDLAEQTNLEEPDSIEIRERWMPEIWVASVVGNTKLEDVKYWGFPRWKVYPLLRYGVYLSTADIKNTELLVQGVVRGLKDLNRDYNKRRTQELTHINSSSNSGWQFERGALTESQIEQYKKYGSSPGVMLEHQKGYQPPLPIRPTPLSQGHAQLSAERATEIKEVSGANTDLLGTNESTASGKAIHLRQRQGMIMIKKAFDHAARTKKMIGKFIISQLSEVFDVESAMKVMGDAWIKKTFGEPIMEPRLDPVTGVPMVDPNTGEPEMLPTMEGGEVKVEMTPESQQKAMETFNAVLNDIDVGKYDVSVGEGVMSETIKYANFLVLQELQQIGVPVPPDAIVDESTLSQATKDRIKSAISAQSQQPSV